MSLEISILRRWSDRPEVPASFTRELESLGREEDPELLGESLLQLGRRSINRDRPELGREIFALIVAEGESRRFPASVQARAREELEVLGGGGSFGRRAENFVGHFVREATSPAALLGMTAGGLAFSTVRFGVLGRLAASPAASFWTRGFGARAVASSAAFVPEVAAFWGTERLARRALHTGPATEGNWRQELAGAALSLGLLKLGGAASSSLFRGAHGLEAGVAVRGGSFTRLSAPLFDQAGLLAGISLAQFVGPQLGLGPSHSGHFWSDVLATLLHFNVSGRLVGGREFARDLAFRERALFRPETRPTRPGDGANALEALQAFQPNLAVAGAGGRPEIQVLANYNWMESRAHEVSPSSGGSGVRLREPTEPPPVEISPELEKAIEPILLGLRHSVDDAALHRFFSELPRGPEIWLPAAQFSRERYARRVLSRELEGSASHEVPLIGWLDGQGSVPHDHGGSSGFEFVAAGNATVRLYRLKPGGGLERVSERIWPEGSVIPIAPEDIHVVTNQQGGGRPLVTLHAYRPFMNPELVRKFSEPENRER